MFDFSLLRKMTRSFRNIFVTVFLCVVFLFLMGFAFPNFISSQNLKLRLIFNSSVASMKFSSSEYLVSNNTESENSMNESTFTSKNADIIEKLPESSFQPSTALNSRKTQEKLKRNKRQIASQEVAKNTINWNFNLNVSRLKSTSSQEAIKNDSKTSPRKQLEVAVYAENQGPEETASNELQKVLGIVGAFMKNIFSSDSENGTDDSKGMNEREIKQLVIEALKERLDLSTTQNFSRGPTEKVMKEFTKMMPSLQEQSSTSVLETSQNLDTLNFGNEANKSESFIHRGRSGRIFLNNFSFFRLGERLLGITTPVSVTEETANIVDDTETEGNIFKDESFLGHPKTEFVTENSKQTSSFHSDSLISETRNSSKDFFNDNTEKLELQPTEQQHKCSDCATESFGLSVLPSEENEGSVDIVLETTEAETLFTGEILETYCKSLLNSLKKSQPNLREESAKADTGVMEDSFVINTDESTTESSMFTDKPRRFFNIFDSGSGRSEIISDENDLLSDTETGKLGDFPSVLDCEEFFSKKHNRKIFSTPNSLNANDIEDKIFQNFGNATLSPKLGEQHLQFSTRLSSSIQTSDKISEGKKTDSFERTSDGNESNFTVNKELFINENGEETTEFREFGLNDEFRTSESTEADSEIQRTTDEKREGRFFNFFNLGSGSDVQENRNVSESRWFLGGFIGSGANSIGTSANVDELEGNIALSSEESFHETQDFSGDGRMLATSDRDTSENFSAASDQEHRFFNFLGFAGSGSGRELTDTTELIVTESDGHLPYAGSENIFTEEPLSSHSQNGLNEYEEDCSDCDHEDNLRREKLLSEATTVLEISKSSGSGRELIDSTELVVSELDGHLPYTGSENIFTEAPLSSHSQNGLNEYEEDCSDCDHEDSLHYEKLSEVTTVLEILKSNGSGRELTDTTELIVTELDGHLPYAGSENIFTEAPLSSQSQNGLNEYEEDCSDCDHEDSLHYEKLPEATTVLETSKSSDNIKSNTTITDLEHESSLISFHLDRASDTDYHDNAVEKVDSLNATENPNQVQTTEMKSRRFVGTLFLTGSGDGGLFGDDGGPINLVEEGSTISPVVFSRRRGRLEDSPCVDCADISGLLKSLETAQSNQTDTHFSSSPTMKLEDNGTMPSASRPTREAMTVKMKMTEIENITLPSAKFSSPFPNLAPVELQPRLCIAARDCNVTLGERCITINSSSVCDCGRAFVRQKETRKCVAKGHIEAKLKLPAEMFDSALEDHESPRYKLTREKAIDTAWLLLRESPEILRIVADVNVAKFTAGSLIISLELVLAMENEDEAETIKGMANKLQKALGDENLVKRASLNIRNATVLSLTSELDPCKSIELNYCSKNAVCVRNEAVPGRHTCYCKEHYLDVSSDPLYPGENCIDECPPFYCGPHGHCEILEDKEMHCLCSGLYFGERCEVPGMVVIGSLSIAAFITLAVLLAVIIRIRCNKRSYGRTPTFRRSEEIGPHVIAGGVSDAIALGEMKGAKISKFSQISTPLENLPVIKVTKPTLNESSISFDYDASFDVTPESIQEHRSENGSQSV